jgi:hypothetical protein
MGFAFPMLKTLTVIFGGVGWPRGKKSSDVEAPKKEAKQHEYWPNDKCATHSAAKGQSQFPHPLRLVRYLLECDDTA